MKEISLMESDVDRALGSKTMETSVLEHSSTISNMDKALLKAITGLTITATLPKTISLASESKLVQMVTYMRDSGKKENVMGKAN